MARLSPAELNALMAPGRMPRGAYVIDHVTGYRREYQFIYGDTRDKLITDTRAISR